MTLLEEFAALLELRGLGTYREDGSAGGTIFLAALPTSPDACVAITRYGAGEQDSKSPRDVVNLQIRCRGGAADARGAEQLAQAVYDTVTGLGPLTMPGGTRLILIVILSGPAYIGRDENGRHEYVINVRATFRRPTSNRPG